MKKVKFIASSIYLSSSICYITYLFTQENIFMLFGGLLLVIASVVLLIANKNTNN